MGGGGATLLKWGATMQTWAPLASPTPVCTYYQADTAEASGWTPGTPPAQVNHQKIATDWAQMSTPLMSLPQEAGRSVSILLLFPALSPLLPPENPGSSLTDDRGTGQTDGRTRLRISSSPNANTKFPKSWLMCFVAERLHGYPAGYGGCWGSVIISSPTLIHSQGCARRRDGGVGFDFTVSPLHQTVLPRCHFDWNTVKGTNEFFSDCVKWTNGF